MRKIGSTLIIGNRKFSFFYGMRMMLFDGTKFYPNQTLNNYCIYFNSLEEFVDLKKVFGKLEIRILLDKAHESLGIHRKYFYPHSLSSLPCFKIFGFVEISCSPRKMEEVVKELGDLGYKFLYYQDIFTKLAYSIIK